MMKGEKWIIDWDKTVAKMNHWLNKKAISYIVSFLNLLTYVLRLGLLKNEADRQL